MVRWTSGWQRAGRAIEAPSSTAMSEVVKGIQNLTTSVATNILSAFAETKSTSTQEKSNPIAITSLMRALADESIDALGRGAVTG
jgi:hypothetical protein